MHTVRRISVLPKNMDDFVKELTHGYSNLYGSKAAKWYAQSVISNLDAAINHHSVDAFSAYVDGNAVGLIFCHIQNTVGNISLIHVLKPHINHEIELELIKSAINSFRERGIEQIICEVIPFFEGDYSKVLLEESFTQIHRALMTSTLDELSWDPETGIYSTELELNELDSAAAVLLNAYENHPDKPLHIDIQNPTSAVNYIRSVMAGEFGISCPAYCRGIHVEGVMQGVIIGFEAAPSVGFVMQVAVSPEYQGKKLGTQLLYDQARAFKAEGLNQWSLGVTLGNPAQNLYNRLGFQIVRNVDAFVWDKT